MRHQMYAGIPILVISTVLVEAFFKIATVRSNVSVVLDYVSSNAQTVYFRLYF